MTHAHATYDRTIALNRCVDEVEAGLHDASTEVGMAAQSAPECELIVTALVRMQLNVQPRGVQSVKLVTLPKTQHTILATGASCCASRCTQHVPPICDHERK